MCRHLGRSGNRDGSACRRVTSPISCRTGPQVSFYVAGHTPPPRTPTTLAGVGRWPAPLYWCRRNLLRPVGLGLGKKKRINTSSTGVCCVGRPLCAGRRRLASIDPQGCAGGAGVWDLCHGGRGTLGRPSGGGAFPQARHSSLTLGTAGAAP